MAFEFELVADCIGCMACVDVCQEKALAFNGTGGESMSEMEEEYEHLGLLKGYPVQVAECKGCMACANMCPVSGIRIIQEDRPHVHAGSGLFLPAKVKER